MVAVLLCMGSCGYIPCQGNSTSSTALQEKRLRLNLDLRLQCVTWTTHVSHVGFPMGGRHCFREQCEIVTSQMGQQHQGSIALAALAERTPKH